MGGTSCYLQLLRAEVRHGQRSFCQALPIATTGLRGAGELEVSGGRVEEFVGGVEEWGLCLELRVPLTTAVCVPGTVLGNLRERVGVLRAGHEKRSRRGS